MAWANTIIFSVGKHSIGWTDFASVLSEETAVTQEEL